MTLLADISNWRTWSVEGILIAIVIIAAAVAIVYVATTAMGGPHPRLGNEHLLDRSHCHRGDRRPPHRLQPVRRA